MFQTRKQLKREIKRLEKALDKEQSINRLAKESGLAKCKGIICKTCKHAVYIDGMYGEHHLVGCDLTVSCPSYKREAKE